MSGRAERMTGPGAADSGAIVRAAFFAVAAAATCTLFLVLDAPAGAAAVVTLAASFVTVLRAGLGLKLLVLFAPLSRLDFMPHALEGVRGLTPFNALFVLAGLSYVVSCALRREKLLKPFGMEWPMLVFAGFLLVSTLRSADEVSSVVVNVGIETSGIGFFRDTVLRGWQYLLLALLIGFESRSRADAHRFLEIFAVSAVVYGAVFLVAFFEEWFRLGAIDVARRSVGKVLNLNINKISSVYAFPLAVGLALYGAYPARSGRRWFWLGVAAVSLFVIVFTVSRSGYAGAAFILAAFMWNRSRPAAVLLPVLVLLLPVWVIGPIFDRIATQLESGNADVILTGRLSNVWLPLLPEVSEHPFLGQGRLAILFSTAAKTGILWRGLNDAHSAYLELLLDGGIVGLALVLAFYWALFRAARRVARSSGDGVARRFAHGYSLGLVAYAISSLTGLSFYPSDGNVFIWALLGVLFAVTRLDRADAARAEARR